MANAIVRLPLGYFPDPNKGRPLGNAKIYVGIVDLDPRILANQLTVTGRQESGAEVPLPQPIRTSFGGVPVDTNGNVVTLLVDGAYAMAVDDSKDAQKYYFSNVLDGAPITEDSLGDAVVIATGTTEARSLSNRFADEVNSKDFASLQAAIDGAAGKTLIIDPGEYNLTGTGLVIASPLSILSEGAIFVWDDTPADYVIKINSAVEWDSIRVKFTATTSVGGVKGVSILANDWSIGLIDVAGAVEGYGGSDSSNQAVSVGADSAQSVNVTIGIIRTTNFDRPITLTKLKDFTIQQLQITTYRRGVYASDCVSGNIYGGYIRGLASSSTGGPGDNGFLMESAGADRSLRNINIYSLEVSNSGEHGVRIGGGKVVSDVTFDNCIVDSAGEPVTATGGSGFKVLGATIQIGAGYHERIRFINCSAINGNTHGALRNNFSGFNIGKCIDSSVQNPIVESYPYGMQIIGCKNLIVDNPQIKDCTDLGVLLYDTDHTTFDFGDIDGVQINSGSINNCPLWGIDMRFFFQGADNIDISGITIDGGEYAVGARSTGDPSSNIRVSADCRNQTIGTINNFGVPAVIDFDGRGEYISGISRVGSLFNKSNGEKMRSNGGDMYLTEGTFIIADDGFISFPMPESGYVTVSVSDLGTRAQVYARATGAPSITIINSGNQVETALIPMTGTTGTDGKATYSVDGLGEFYIENRRGAELEFRVSFE